MRLMLLFPYALGGLLIFSIAGLWVAVSFQQTAFVQVFYVLSIFFAFSVFIILMWSSASYALRPFEGYWDGGYPILLATVALSYGLYKSAPQMLIVGILCGAIIISFFIAKKTPGYLHRYIPLLAIIGFLIVGELPVWREVKVLVLGAFAGSVAALVVIYRLRT